MELQTAQRNDDEAGGGGGAERGASIRDSRRFEMNTEMVDVPLSEHTGQADHRDAEPQSDATVMPDQQLAATLGHSSPLGVDAVY